MKKRHPPYAVLTWVGDAIAFNKTRHSGVSIRKTNQTLGSRFTPDYAGSAPDARPGHRVRVTPPPASAGSPPGSVSSGG